MVVDLNKDDAEKVVAELGDASRTYAAPRALTRAMPSERTEGQPAPMGHDDKPESEVERASEVVISDSPPDDCALLVAKTGTGADGTSILVLLSDRPRRRLVALDWAPGSGLAVSKADIPGKLPSNIVGAAVEGHRLVVSNYDGFVYGINRITGSVVRIPNLPSPAVTMPDGRRLVAATDRGLLTIDLVVTTADRAVLASGIEPLFVRRLDNPSSMILLPGAEPNSFLLAIGCYGAVELVTVENATHRDPAPVRSRTLSTSALAYDPILVSLPPHVVPALTGPMVYAMDEGGTGLVAIDTRTDAMVPYPHGLAGYGSVKRAVASLDSTACLVTVRGGRIFSWSPGSTPRPVELAGEPIVWHRDRALVMDRQRAVVRETVLAR